MNFDSSSLPSELIDFLSSNAGAPIHFDRELQPNIEVETVEFFSLDELFLSTFTVDSYQFFLNYGEFDEDPELQYEIPGVSLIKNCNDYSPEGFLVFFPALSAYGSWDPDHQIVRTFVHFRLPIQEPALAAYVNALWYPSHATSELLRPWDDPRCETFSVAQPN
ncbi:MAG: hypothetical protein MI807_08875 [Verrucomicrobiales bacterium]|nr:hypothetical protein [Verrucomicrobiales bacterium]